VIITHTSDGIIVEDAAGTQEIALEESKPVITDIGGGYVSVDGNIWHHKAWDHQSTSAEHIVEKHNEPTNTYVQNEEQSESDQWSKIAGTAISEEEYLEAVRRRQQNKDA
jgi:hypothetical protein